MLPRIRALAFPLAGLCAIALVIALGTYATQVSAEPSGAVEYAQYQNARWHFLLAVPADMIVSEYHREGDGQTVQFLDATGHKELMISAWPYSQLDVTLGRLSEPIGTSDQPDHLEIVDVVRDDLFTVLFQKNGISYAVVTLPEYEAWLTDILTTWQFTD